MAQVVSRRFTLLLRVVLLFVLGSLITVLIAFRVGAGADAAQGDAITQPVPFSHEHHVRDDGIDCRYCHTSVETSSFAGIPSTQICMNCHSQIWVNAPVLQPVRDSWATGTPIAWNRVYDLPDFVYFNHS